MFATIVLMKLPEYLARVECARSLSKRIGVHASTLGRIRDNPDPWEVGRKIVEGTRGAVSAEELLGIADTTPRPCRKRRRKRAA